MEERIKEIIVGVIESKGDKIDISLIHVDTLLREDLGLDSFNLAELTVYIEDEFGVDVFEDGVINRVGEIFQKVSHK